MSCPDEEVVAAVEEDDLRTSSPATLMESLLQKAEEVGSAVSSRRSSRHEADSDWHGRYLQLETSLQRFKEQAAHIRDLLKIKLADLERRAVEAESRANEADEKVRLMEQRLSEQRWNTGEPEDSSDLHALESVCKEKDKVISTLEQQVAEQKKLRIQDAKQVEAKAAKIKEWVTNKLKELEEQNLHLREQNQKCNEQLELLKNRLVQLSQLNPRPSKLKDRTSTEDSSRGSFEDRGESDDSLPDVGEHPPGSLYSYDANHHSIGPTDGSINFETNPVYAAVDYSKKKAHIRSAPPRVKIERKKYQENHASIVSSTASEDPCDSEADSQIDSADMEFPSSDVSGTSSARTSSGIADTKRKPVPPPRSRVPGKPGSPAMHHAATHPGSPALNRTHTRHATSGSIVLGSKLGTSTSSNDTYGSLDRKLSAQRKLNLVEFRGGSERRKVVADDEVHDYAEIYTPSKELVSDFTTFDREGRPPTPPLHRFPSWESRIYEVAINGINKSCDSLDTVGSSLHNYSGKSAGDYTNGAFTELNIPVYATVKGRASQIRSVPFTGESSDSSDNEDTRVTGTSSQTTSGDTESSMSTGSPSKSGKTSSLSPSPAKQGSASPTKSVQRDTSVESALSDDYAIPPDAVSADALSIDSLDAPAYKSPNISDSPKRERESLEKSGYLTKLGGKLKTWKKRWFVLKSGVLSYYKSQTDVNRKPQGQIVLDDVCRVTRAEGAATFEIATGKRNYYLTADSVTTMEEWVKVLQNVLRRNATRLLLTKEENKPAIEGWLNKVKHGHSRRCWCVLIGRMFLYFKTPSDTTPLGQINMRDAHVEEVVHVSDSDEDDPNDTMSKSEYTIGIFPNHQGPTYLLMSSKQEMDTWLYHLTVVSSGDNLVGTQYEQLIAKLMEVDGDENSVLWRHPLLLFSKENISQPLTTLPSEQLQIEAVKLFKSIQLFISVPLDTSGIDYHVALAQNALHQCLTTPELQNELICQLMKQTSRHSHQKIGVQQLLLCATQSLFLCDSSGAEKSSPTSTCPPEKPQPIDNKLNPPPFVFIQGWQLLALAVSLFVPKNRTLWYLKSHLQRNADAKSEAGKYSIYCQRALDRALANGERECKPSRMEVLSILLKNPFHHSHPHSIPVHFLNGTYQVVGFDGSTTVEEFIHTLNTEAGIRDAMQSGFALYSDDPIEKSIEHCLNHAAKNPTPTVMEETVLHPSAKLCDVISKWEQALRERHLGKFENTRVIKLTYKNRLCFRQLLKAETDKERLLTAFHINEEILQGRFPLTKNLALELAALMAQIEFGDYNGEKVRGSGAPPNNPQHQLQQTLERFFPPRFIEPQKERQVAEAIRDKWITLKGRGVLDCVRIYLNCVRKWSFCGAKLFSAKLKTKEQQTVWLAVTEDAISLLDYSCMQPWCRYPYSSVMTFGGCKDDFMLVVCPSDSESATERLLFAMPKPKILELTLLIADYMNALGRPMAVPPSPQASTLSRLERLRAKIRATATSTSSASAVTLLDYNSTSASEADQRSTKTDSKRRGGSDST